MNFDFESGASTNSATGARRADHSHGGRRVNAATAFPGILDGGTATEHGVGSIRDDAPRQRRRRKPPDHGVPVGPRALVEDPRRRVIEGVANIVET
jgi:hypothetical protein